MLSSKSVRVLYNSKFWAISIAGWILLSLTEATALHLDALRGGRSSHLDLLLLERSLADSVWIIVAAIMYATTHRTMAARAGTLRVVRQLTLLGLLLAPLHTVSGAIAYVLVQSEQLSAILEHLRRAALTSVVWDVFTYVLLALTCYAVLMHQHTRRHERESAELRTRLAQAELELLRAQLEPHFLFNALNTVAGLIREQRQEPAIGALAQLSELLRYVIQASRHERVPLAWELQFVSSYLQLQQLRYGPRLQYAICEDRMAKRCDIPPLLLQPLVENAVVHGASRTGAASTIEVHASIVESQLQLEIHNTGRQPEPADERRSGVGLTNTRQRLERIYGGAFRLTAGPEGTERYRVSISLPQASSA